MLEPYKENIEQIRSEIIQIGADIVNANKISLSGLKENDLSMLKDINLPMKKLALRISEIDNLIVKTLALYSPEAKDLRAMVSYLKITNELSRVASCAKDFAKMFRKYFSSDLDKSVILEYAVPLLKSSNLALSTSISMIEKDNEKIIEEIFNKVLVEDSKVDDLYAMIEKNILKLISKYIELSKDYFEILRCLRRLEKISARASSIAHLLVFAEMGGELEQA